MTEHKTGKKFSLTNEYVFEAVKIVISVLIALGITFVVLLFIGDDPVGSFFTMLTAPFTKLRYFGNVLEATVPIVFSGLACSLLFRTGLFNLGIEGIYYISGVMCSIIAIQNISSSVLHPILAIVAGGLLGGVIMLGQGFLKAKFNTNELILSLMLNSIFLGVGLWVIKTFFRADDYGAIATPLFSDTARLPALIPATRVTVGIFLAIIAVIAVYILLYKTRLGYQIRMTGANPMFAKYSGMNAFTLFMLVHFIAGLLGGVGTSVELLSIYTRFSWILLPNLGFTGALIAMMGKNHPVGIFFSAFGISYLKTGAEIMSRNTNVPVEIISIVEAVLVLLISSQYFLRKMREKRLLKERVQSMEGGHA